MRFGSAHWCLVFAVLAAGLMPVTTLAQDRSPAERRGEALLAKNCARCHAIGRIIRVPAALRQTCRGIAEHRIRSAGRSSKLLRVMPTALLE